MTKHIAEIEDYIQEKEAKLSAAKMAFYSMELEVYQQLKTLTEDCTGIKALFAVIMDESSNLMRTSVDALGEIDLPPLVATTRTRDGSSNLDATGPYRNRAHKLVVSDLLPTGLHHSIETATFSPGGTPNASPVGPTGSGSASASGALSSVNPMDHADENDGDSSGEDH